MPNRDLTIYGRETAHKFPTELKGFRALLNTLGKSAEWTFGTVPDPENPGSMVDAAWLSGQADLGIYLLQGHGGVHAYLSHWYHFELSRLSQDWDDNFSWQDHVGSKSWVEQTHINFLDALEEIAISA